MPKRTDPHLADLVKRLRDAKAHKKAAEEEVSKVQSELLDLMHSIQRSTVTVTSNGVVITANAVHSTTTNIDEIRLRKEMGAQAFDKLTVKVLDKDKLNDAIARDEVDANVVAQCSEVVPKRPYITVKERTKPASVERTVPTNPETVRGGRTKSKAAKVIGR